MILKNNKNLGSGLTNLPISLLNHSLSQYYYFFSKHLENLEKKMNI